MNRRRFLSSTVLSGVALAGLTQGARAFSQQKCDTSSPALACAELIRHHELLAKLELTLAERGLDGKQRQAVLAAAICPFCGQPLVG